MKKIGDCIIKTGFCFSLQYHRLYGKTVGLDIEAKTTNDNLFYLKLGGFDPHLQLIIFVRPKTSSTASLEPT